MERNGLAQRRVLSGADAAFLYLERKEIPLHIACVSVFDGPIPFGPFVANIDSKLHLIPRYRQIAVASPFNLGYPTWEWDPHFDIRRHVFRVRLDPPGGEAELEKLAGRILSQVMDRNKPLWDIHVVEGLGSGRGALIPRVHHALADGISGAALLSVILDPTPEASRAIAKRQYRVPRRKPKQESFADALNNAVHSALENLLAAEAGLVSLAENLLTGPMQQGLQGLISLLPELLASEERLPFNKPCTGERRFCWTEFSFADVQAIRAAAGTTINDVILTVVTRAVARYVRLHGQSVDHRFVRMVCPYSLRRGDHGESLGNQISFLPVALPLDEQDPLETLRAVTTRTRIMKCVRAADLVALAAAWLGSAPPPLQALFWKNIPLVPLPLPLFNMICTNVPGSPVPLYSMGRRMLASYPQVPTGYELGIGCAAQSYDGKVFFGLTSDTDAAPDATRLRDFILVSFQELCRAAGVKKSAARRTRTKPAATAA
jgi:diacylglycerol O-acyltransferase